MPYAEETPKSLDELLKELEQAVRDGDHEQATLLERNILKRLVLETEDQRRMEVRVRELMQKLDESKLAVTRKSTLSVDSELSVEAPTVGGGKIYSVWFGTNRTPSEDGKSFTYLRSEETSYGCAHVFVPKAHEFGETGNDLWTRLKRWQFQDDHLKVHSLWTGGQSAFFDEVRKRIAEERSPTEQAHAVIYIHGYNVSFDDAAVRAAQIGVDLAIRGAVAFFSWPSCGSPLDYLKDAACIEASESAITKFLIDFVTNCSADKVHVIAHSMGNCGLLRALQRIAANAEAKSRVKFGQIILAAPDLDRALFLDLSHIYPDCSERTTLYASPSDWAVHASSKFHGAPRAGYFPPETVANHIDTVVVPNFDVDLLGHGYYASAEALLYDISTLIFTNKSPPRQRFDESDFEAKGFWRLKK